MTTIYNMIDLCCGRGGASAAMRDRGWNVTRFDCMADVEPDVLCDVRNLIDVPHGVDLLWASPPCNEIANPRNWGRGREWQPDLSVMLACKRLIDQSSPHFWIIENVWKARPFFSPILGQVRAIIPGHAIWGNLPCLFPTIPSYKGAWHGPRHYPRKRREVSLERALLPYEISLAIALAVERRLADETISQP